MKYVAAAIICLSLLAPTAMADEFTAELKLRGPQDVPILRKLDISVDSIRNNIASAYLNDKEERALEAAGIDVKRTLDEAFWDLDKNGLAKGYHNPETCEEALKAWAQEHSEVCKLIQIGTSVKGRAIWALKISTNAQVHDFKPMVRFCGAHHGNEIASSETVLMFTKYILDNYETDERIGNIVKNVEMWLIPMVNPDGVAKRSRYNANYKDLNRNYGYRFRPGWKAGTPYSEPETRAFRDHAANIPFSLSLSFHCSGDLVNYVWNYTTVRCPDQDLIFGLSEGYASFNEYEVTQGADWYAINGDTNDWAYGCSGCLDSTIEIANPSYSGINKVFERNKEPMLYYCEQVQKGICGVVTNEEGVPLKAFVEAIPPRWPTFSHPEGGDFHRVLLPGTYKLRVWAPGHAEKIIENITVSDGAATRVDVTLEKSAGTYHALQLCEIVVPRNSSNTTHGPHVLGPPDSVFCSLGDGGHLVVDLSDEFPTGTGAKITIHDEPSADENAESYQLLTSKSQDGPWEKIGQGTGTATIEVAKVERYLKVADKSKEFKRTTTPGLDLESITVVRRSAVQTKGFQELHQK